MKLSTLDNFFNLNLYMPVQPSPKPIMKLFLGLICGWSALSILVMSLGCYYMYVGSNQRCILQGVNELNCTSTDQGAHIVQYVTFLSNHTGYFTCAPASNCTNRHCQLNFPIVKGNAYYCTADDQGYYQGSDVSTAYDTGKIMALVGSISLSMLLLGCGTRVLAHDLVSDD